MGCCSASEFDLLFIREDDALVYLCWRNELFVVLKLVAVASIRGEEEVRSSSKSGCINNDCDVWLLIVLVVLTPPALDRLELDSTLPMLPNILMDEEDLLLLLLLLLFVPPLPLLLIGEASETVSAAAGGEGDRHFILAGNCRPISEADNESNALACLSLVFLYCRYASYLLYTFLFVHVS